MPDLFDVLEVEIKSGKILGFMGEKKTERNADAIERMAILRRGVETSFYVSVPTGSKKIGEHHGKK